ncbi:MAG: hypothetical protein CMK09_16985 [Ponticaulis sp.]|nr:hypothetical protein [Ponticaulis sp.]|tara:strand:+ start:12716 stop:14047 length:1332 start_codon:yes stop_codon:yes gene_type:complete
MTELLTGMWGFLAGAGVLGLIIGWAIRGVFIPRAKTVNVTSQSSSEGPTLTAEDRQKLSEADRTAMALAAAQERMANMEERLESARKESETDKAMIAQLEAEKDSLSAAPAIAPEPVMTAEPAEPGVHISEDDREAELWKLSYLTARVRFLEGKLEPQPATEPPVTSETVSPEMEAEFSAAKAEVETLKAELETANDELTALKSAAAEDAETQIPTRTDDSAMVASMSWQNRYLKARVNHLENARSAPVTAAAPVEMPVVEDKSEKLAELEAENLRLKKNLSESNQGSSQSEQEMARLRWRNRYLEGRLKYLEAATLDAASEADDSIHNAPSPVPSPVSAPVEPVETLPEPEPEPDPVEAVDEVRPKSIDAPNGEPDDLKLIGGIGPKIEGILNELGIFHFSQIASWSAGEEAWIDSYLRFQGRVMREKWVDQAVSLANEPDS